MEVSTGLNDEIFLFSHMLFDVAHIISSRDIETVSNQGNPGSADKRR
jgi:hypothetical protein